MKNIEKNPHSFAVVIEWENAISAGNERARQMLAELRNQINELKNFSVDTKEPTETSYLKSFRFPAEVIISFDTHEVVEAELRWLARELIPESDNNINLRILPSPLSGYYGLKTNGINHTDADLVILLDSDVIPKEGWLRNMLATFSDDKVNVVLGNTYIDEKSVYGKAFALAWFFHVRSDRDDLEETDGSYTHVNSIAYRKEILDKYPLDSSVGGYRGSCGWQIAELRNAGIPVHYNHKAKIGHPPPRWFKHFMHRAVGEGRDDYLNAKYSYNALKKNPSRITAHGKEPKEIKVPLSLRTFRKGFNRLQKIVRNRQQADLSLAATPFAVAIMAFYYFLYLLGNLATRLFPQFMLKHFLF
jgi:hypothetical protein